MTPFPYLEILKKAYELTREHIWLWVFGLFLGGTSMFNATSLNLVIRQTNFERPDRLQEVYQAILKFGLQRSDLFAGAIVLAFILLFSIAAISALSYGSVIVAASRFAEDEGDAEKLNFWRALSKARNFFWRIVGLQVFVTGAFAVLVVVLASPVVYLFSSGAAGRASILMLLALAIFIPAVLVFAFLHLFGPIFIVLWDRRIGEAISLSFNLLRHKFKESIILAAFLLGLSFSFIVIEVFSIILFSVPVAILLWLAFQLQFILAAQVLLVLAALAALVFLICLNAGFAVFQSISWVFAVREMVRTLKLKKEEQVFAAEPA